MFYSFMGPLAMYYIVYGLNTSFLVKKMRSCQCFAIRVKCQPLHITWGAAMSYRTVESWTS